MYTLFLDESGKNTLKELQSQNPHFSIGGTLVHANSSDFIKRRGDQIKFKYWGHTKVTFHATSIRRLDGDFEIFKDIFDPISGVLIKDCTQIRADFYADFIDYIEKSNFKFICVCVNKNDWISKNPALVYIIKNGGKVTSFEKQLTKDIFEKVVKIYMCHLKRKRGSEGRIMVEASDIRQDGDILAIYNQIMFQGIPTMGMSSKLVREILTCISFATKNNRDHETQLADIGSHFLGIKSRIEDGTYNKPLSDFESAVIKTFESKAFVDNCDAMLSKSIRRL